MDSPTPNLHPLRPWQWAEITALVAAIGGSVVAAITQQCLWVTSPVIVSLALNWMNRQGELRELRQSLDQKLALEDLNNRRLNHLELQLTQAPYIPTGSFPETGGIDHLMAEVQEILAQVPPIGDDRLEDVAEDPGAREV